MFLSQKIDKKLCQNYTKLYIYQISYKSYSIKQFIIDKIIRYSLYSPYYVTKTSANGSAIYWSADTHDNNTALLLAEILVI